MLATCSAAQRFDIRRPASVRDPGRSGAGHAYMHGGETPGQPFCNEEAVSPLYAVSRLPTRIISIFRELDETLQRHRSLGAVPTGRSIIRPNSHAGRT